MKNSIETVLTKFFSEIETKKENLIEIPLQEKSFNEWMEVALPWLQKIDQIKSKEFYVSLISSPEPLVRLIFNEKKKYERIYTSGCFDFFHYGHLNILQRSKELCNKLIVGVSTDELIETDKGKRPLIPYEERAKIVASIKYVDEVIPQVDKNKQRIVDKHKIDAITVGDDWKGKYPPVTCEMVYFKYTPNVSSTIIKNALKI